MKNFVHPYARYTGLIGATVWPKFRTISGLPWRRTLATHQHHERKLDFTRPQIILGKSDCFEACCEGIK